MNTPTLRLATIGLLAGVVGLVACATATPSSAVSSPPPVTDAVPTDVPASGIVTAPPAVLSRTGGARTDAAGVTPAANPSAGPVDLRVETVASGLEVPRALAFAPDGRLFVAERPGRVRVIVDGMLQPEPVATIADVAAEREGGLLGLALDPEFAQNGRLYLYHTYRDGAELRNRVVRFVEAGNRLVPESREVILDPIPGGRFHHGGRIAFGPDGKLYVTTGDAFQPQLAQDRDSLAGKILRLDPDGSIPTDNPFPGSPVYSYGHRNPQGLAWQPGTGRLYATEHGATGHDEVNLLEPGRNYGWPTAEGANHPPEFASPVSVYQTTIAPSGAAFYDGEAIPQWRGSLLFTTLRGQHLHRLILAPAIPAV